MTHPVPLVNRLSLEGARQTAWIFGAGASRCAPYGVPTQLGLLRRFGTQPVAGSTSEARARFRLARTRLPQWLRRVRPAWSWEADEISLEEVFSHYEFLASPLGLPAGDPRRAEALDALEDLQLAVRSAVSVFGASNALKFRPFERKAKGSAPYAELIEALLTAAWSRQPANFEAERHALVTMNYDINLDRSLLHLKAKGLGTTVDYCLTRVQATSDADPAFLLLRLHGSMNWKRCGVCHAVVSTGPLHAEIQTGETCGTCGAAAMGHLLVNPSFSRTFGDGPIVQVWQRTRAALLEADRWVFIGYSLPQADVHFRAMLRDALALRQARGEDTQVVLVGRRPGPTEPAPPAGTPDEFTAALAAYHALFGEALTAWDATPGGFADFVRALVP